MAKTSVIPFLLLALLVAVQAQDFFPSDFPSEDSSLFSESDFPDDDDSDEINSLPLLSQPFPLQTQSQNSFPSEINLSFDFQGANSPFMTNPLDSSDDPLSSSSSDSEFLGEEDSQDEPNSILPDLPKVPPLLPHEPVSPPPLPSETPSTPPPTPSEAPDSPLPPSASPRVPSPSSPTTCKGKCAAKCNKKKVPLLHNLCSKVCKKRCVLLYAQVVYNCTDKCAEAMPNTFKSDEKKVAGYGLDSGGQSSVACTSDSEHVSDIHDEVMNLLNNSDNNDVGIADDDDKAEEEITSMNMNINVDYKSPDGVLDHDSEALLSSIDDVMNLIGDDVIQGSEEKVPEKDEFLVWFDRIVTYDAELSMCHDFFAN
ncbi:hypothetical protein COLO4_36535 [Corchorus olitorius]|uniref:Uncharacterized protein n=1 Tax=Corchorus olitorius TaxID=93759 RepID=A0A1R3G833_9ROSI|nr:hypothetical protein COLO4_36535 [Corchorus olitorius]